MRPTTNENADDDVADESSVGDNADDDNADKNADNGDVDDTLMTMLTTTETKTTILMRKMPNNNAANENADNEIARRIMPTSMPRTTITMIQFCSIFIIV